MISIIKYSLVLLVLLFANTVQTITGFAGTLLAMPMVMRLIGVTNAKAILNVFTMLACIGIAWQNRRYINKKELLKIIAGMLIGMVIGIRLFDLCPQKLLLRCYGGMIIIVAIRNLVSARQKELGNVGRTAIILAAGIIHGMFVSGGALLVVYAVFALKDKDEFRATISSVWVILDCILIFSHYTSGYYNRENLMLIAISVTVMILSIKLGNALYKKIDQKVFMKMICVLLMISGVMSII